MAALADAGVETFATYAYCTSYQPSQTSDAPLVEFLTRTFGSAPNAGSLASSRRLFFESHALALDELRSRAERTESSEARSIPLAEKMDRVRALKAKLTGITFTSSTEPSHALIDRACQQFEDGVVAYIPLNKCTSRQDETLQSKTDSTISMDQAGNLRIAKKQRTEDTRLEGEHRLKMAFQRRAMAYDIANVGSFQVMDLWTQTLFDKLNEPQLPGHRAVSLDQILQADKTLWVKLADETRASLSATAGAVKPVDVAFRNLTQHAEVLLHLTPFQSSSQSPRTSAL